MNVLTFSVGDLRYALDGALVRRIVDAGAAGAAEEGPAYDLARLFPDRAAAWDTRVILEAEGQVLVLRTTAPQGFRRVEPGSLVPLPRFLFREGRRPIRAVFLDSGQPYLLLNEAELGRRARTACS
jgi:hypothetical protein